MRQEPSSRRAPRALAMLLPIWLLLALLWPPPQALASSPMLASSSPMPASSSPMLASSSTPVLTLDASASRVDAWDTVRVLRDPTHSLELADVIARADEFRTPEVPHANFGPTPETIWLRVPVRATAADRWILELDYPPLNRIEAWVVDDGTAVAHALMGSDIPAGNRPIRSRAHVLALDLPPGSIHEIYLRIDSTTTVATPIHIYREAAFLPYESLRMLLLGLMFGAISLLLAMTLANGLSMRDPVFFHYGLLLIGVTTLVIPFSGLGHQFLWDTQAGYLRKISLFGALLALVGASRFVVSALDMRQRSPRMARCLDFVGFAALLALLASIAGLLDYRGTAAVATVLGPVQTALALTESIRQARPGNRIAVYMVIGWGAYAIGALSFASLLRGLVPANLVTVNLFLLSSLIEMFVWMRVLAMRIDVLRKEADRAAAEKQALHALAHTDALTGLLNRRGLVRAIDKALACERPAFAVYLIDLDGFKTINDRLGHQAGDEALIHVSRQLRAALRSDDVIARLGGDEFVVLAVNVDRQADAETIGRKMQDLIREPLEQPGGRVTNIDATIGFAMAPQDGTDPDTLLRAADRAMYAGKSSGRQRVRRAEIAAEAVMQ